MGIIILRLACVSTALPIQEIMECSAPKAKAREKRKKLIVSMSLANSKKLGIEGRYFCRQD
jgi:hypothetical protein